MSLLAPLTYLYLPLRAWMGAEWTVGQPIADAYALPNVAGQPVGVRLGLYRALPEGGFENSEWLFLPLP